MQSMLATAQRVLGYDLLQVGCPLLATVHFTAVTACHAEAAASWVPDVCISWHAHAPAQLPMSGHSASALAVVSLICQQLVPEQAMPSTCCYRQLQHTLLLTNLPA